MKTEVYYLVTFLDHNNEKIFRNHRDKELFLRLYEYFMKDEVYSYAWNILPCRAMFLCSIRIDCQEIFPFKEILLYKRKNFKRILDLFNDYLRAEYSPHIFLDAQARPLEEYPASFLAGFTAYLHCLPVFLGLSDSYVEYDWSSYLPLLHHNYTFLQNKTVISWFGGRQEFRDYHQQMIEVKKIKNMVSESGKNF